MIWQETTEEEKRKQFVFAMEGERQWGFQDRFSKVLGLYECKP